MFRLVMENTMLSNLTLRLLLLSVTFPLMASTAFSMENEDNSLNYSLNYQHRPQYVQDTIEDCFRGLESFTQSSWNIYNGRETYDHLNISQRKLAKKIVEDAHKEGRKDVYILDSGAGNFQSCDAFAKYINEHRSVLPEDMTVHIIGTRGERYEGKEVEQIGLCKIYKFGLFKIEDHQNEFCKRGLEIEGQIDLTISNWAIRHYADPLGTWLRFFNTTRPKTGLMIMDWCYYLYETEPCQNKLEAFTASRDHLLDLLMHINAPFLFQACGDGWERETDRFAVRRKDDKPLELPLAYAGIKGCYGLDYDIGSSQFVKFKVLDPAFKANKLKRQFESINQGLGYSSANFLWGDVNLFQWFKTNGLISESFYSNPFQQLFQIKKGEDEITPLYTPEEITQKKQELSEKAERRAEKEKLIKLKNQEIDKKRKDFFSSLKIQLPREIRPVAEGIANGAREIEYSLWAALRQGNFEEAQSIINSGADVNRVFDYSWFDKTLLDYATATREFPKETIHFLLKNGAKTREANLDNALYFYKSVEDVKLLVTYGVEIKDVDLALYRSIDRGEQELIDLFISKRGNVNSFINGLPMIYGASGRNETWNYLIDKGAKGACDQEMPKRPI